MMTRQVPSTRSGTFLAVTEPVRRFVAESRWAQRAGTPGISDFVLGNPHEPPLAGFVDALRRHIEPQRNDWFAYTDNLPASRTVVAESLQRDLGMPFEPDDIFLTTGAFAGLVVALHALTDPGDQVIFISPPWFFYEALIQAAGCIAVRVACDPKTFDLDVAAIERATTEKTRAIIVNSPNNPTGKIYARDRLVALAKILTEASVRQGRPISIISDEAYRKILYDENKFVSPSQFYPQTLLVYTFGKTLLTPGQRIGYLALPPSMLDRPALRDALFASQLAVGWAFPNALLQHALPDLEPLSVDIKALQRKRDRVVSALRSYGYETTNPEATFYVMVRSPLADDLLFTNYLAESDVFCLPGTIAEMPGWFRISLTASEEMIERALPVFELALREASRAVKL